MEDKLVYTVSEIAELLGIAKIKAYELAKSKDFPAIQIGRRIIIPKERFHEWLNTTNH